jgi:hypothetical protein
MVWYSSQCRCGTPCYKKLQKPMDPQVHSLPCKPAQKRLPNCCPEIWHPSSVQDAPFSAPFSCYGMYFTATLIIQTESTHTQAINTSGQGVTVVHLSCRFNAATTCGALCACNMYRQYSWTQTLRQLRNKQAASALSDR